MGNELISVIVPVYNVEKYVCKCINSILNQSYQNLEIFLVDDGSIDNSGAICDQYAISDSRIRVIHKPNGGLSDARNAALDLITGDYVTFIDSDDFVKEDYVEYLYNLLKSCNADISICSACYFNEKHEMTKCAKFKVDSKIMNTQEALFEMLRAKYFSNSAWGKLYKTSLFHEIRYPKGRIFEDAGTTYKVFLKSSIIIFGGKDLYCYLCRNGSISRSKTFNLNRLDSVLFAEEMAGAILKEYPDLQKACKCRCFDSYVATIRLINEKDYYDLFYEMWDKIKKSRKTVLTFRSSGIKRKLYSFLSYFGVKFFKFCLKKV